MNANQFRIRTSNGDSLPVQADGMGLHDSGALVFSNMDASGNPVPAIVFSPHAYRHVEALGPVQQPPQQPPPVNRAARRAKKA